MMAENVGWTPITWVRAQDFHNRVQLPHPRIDRLVSPFYKGERYAVRMAGRCLNVAGEWEWEPLPSERAEEFYQRCQFLSFEAAAARLKEAGAFGAVEIANG